MPNHFKCFQKTPIILLPGCFHSFLIYNFFMHKQFKIFKISRFQKNGYTFAIVYSSKCVTVFLNQTIQPDTQYILSLILKKYLAKLCLTKMHHQIQNRYNLSATLLVWGRFLTFRSHYCTRAIISRGLYIFYPISNNNFFFLRRFFSENSVLMYGFFSKSGF